jgi:hypothetical protein
MIAKCPVAKEKSKREDETRLWKLAAAMFVP